MQFEPLILKAKKCAAMKAMDIGFGVASAPLSRDGLDNMEKGFARTRRSRSCAWVKAIVPWDSGKAGLIVCDADVTPSQRQCWVSLQFIAPPHLQQTRLQSSSSAMMDNRMSRAGTMVEIARL